MNYYQQLVFKIELERLVTEREGMIAENKIRESRDETLAYNEAAFQDLCSGFNHLSEAVRNS